MINSKILAAVQRKFELLRPLMTERMRRQWAASEAESLGRGGMTTVAQATGRMCLPSKISDLTYIRDGHLFFSVHP